MRVNEIRLSELRLDNGLKQKDIAKILGISENRYGKYERGINDISLSLSNILANYYQISLDYLYGISDKKIDYVNKNINLKLLCIRLKELRKSKHLTQQEVGDAIGFPQTTYCHYEHGKSVPTSFKVLYFAMYYNVSFDYLVGRSDKKNWNESLKEK